MPFSKEMPILVVDDHQSMRRTIGDILRAVGLKTLVQAENGRQALEIMAQQRVDFVILDWSMPEMDGLTALRAIRANPDWKDLPVLMVTAEAEREHVVAAIESGVTNYVVKPFTPNTIYRKLRDIFGVSL
jgi:two-component system chemotaxis response regulator CheY